MGKLYIVATPIGNLEDITLRALNTLQEVDVIYAEDTRNTIKLLNHFEIKKKLTSLHHHTTEKKLNAVVDEIKSLTSAALVSDAGTPLVSDPGGKLIEKLKEHEVEIIPIPGASAVTAALSVSGFSADRFKFYGFIPVKKGKDTLLKEISDAKITSIFFESPHRIKKTLERLKEKTGPKRQIVLGREMTKKFEEYLYGSIEEISMALNNRAKIKGEITVVVSGKSKSKTK